MSKQNYFPDRSWIVIIYYTRTTNVKVWETLMRIFQYWDTGTPPEEVAEWIESFRIKNPDLKHRLYDRDAAAWFIRKYIGDREKRAFEACAVPAMQSDYFRYCAILAKGGVYVDADFRCVSPLSGLLRSAPNALIAVWDRHLVAGLLMVRRPRDVFLRACLDLATANVEARWGPNSYMAAGPGVINAIRVLADPRTEKVVTQGFDNEFGRKWQFPDLKARAAAAITITPELVASLGAFTLVHILDTQPWIETPIPAYKSTELHWLKWRAPIYCEPASAEPD